jgi:hypothetical protein
VRHNPRFYLREFAPVEQMPSSTDKILEPLLILTVFSVITFALFWLVRTFLDHKRWTRVAATQADVHNKILDRFGTSAELLEYVKSPAGSKFLESAPIQVRSEPAAPSTPMTRVLWSVQAGVIVCAGAVGMLIVSSRIGPTAQGLFVLGMIALCIGAGFIASAAVTLLLSRRLGLWQPAETASES